MLVDLAILQYVAAAAAALPRLLTPCPPSPFPHAVVAAFSQAFKRCKEAIDAGLAAFQAKDYEVSRVCMGVWGGGDRVCVGYHSSPSEGELQGCKLLGAGSALYTGTCKSVRLVLSWACQRWQAGRDSGWQ